MSKTLLSLLLLLSASAGCPDDEVGLSLFVDLRTDWTPVTDVATVEVVLTVAGDTRTQTATIGRDFDFVTGYRVAEYGGLPVGPAVLRTILRDPEGAVLAQRTIEFELTTTRGTTVVITRGCLAVSCPGVGDPAAQTECHGGTCVEPSCYPGSGACPAGCLADSDCADAVDCTRGICAEGACLSISEDRACEDGQRCDPNDGCVPVDGADGGRPDAGAGDTGVAHDAGPCVPTTCASLRADCGPVPDGCGAFLDCGSCASPDTCGGGGIANLCGCTATTCMAEGAQCGAPANACGGTLDCGSCPGSATCSAFACACGPDGNEPNDTLMDASPLGTARLDGAGVASLFDQTVHHAGDEDLYRLTVDTSAGLGDAYSLNIDLGGIPSGEDYDLAAYVACGGAIPPVDCVIGTNDTFDGVPGCISSNAGNTNEEVELIGRCFAAPAVFVRVIPRTWAGVCSDYFVGYESRWTGSATM